MHIGQFSMVICGFVLAIAIFLLWPYDPSPFIALVTLVTAAVIYGTTYYFNSHTVRRGGQIILAMALGFAWGQARTHMESTQTGKAVLGEIQISGVVEWHEAQARGSR